MAGSALHFGFISSPSKMPNSKMLGILNISLTPEMIDEHIGPVLQAAKTGDLNLIKNVNWYP